MAENRKERDKRFYYSRSQMMLLGAAFTAASAVIFFLGMYVGKSIEARKMVKSEEPLIKVPVKPAILAPAPVAGASKEETVFESDTKTALAQPLVEAKAKEAKEVKETTDSKLAAKGEAKEKKNPAKEPPAAKAAETAVEKTPPVDTAKVDDGESKDAGKNWRVQVNAYPDELSAKQVVDRLKNKGYNAYFTEVRYKGKIWYRVNVGKYGTKEEAEKMRESLKTKENFAKAFATAK